VDFVINWLFDAEPVADGDGHEDISQWESQGRSLGIRAVVVEVRTVPGRVIAIVPPVEAARAKAKCPLNGLWGQGNTGS